MRHLYGRLAWSAVLLLGCGCGSPTPQTNNVPSGELRGAIVILVDTLRADRLSAYGHVRETSPDIDELARSGVLFEQVISAAPWTLASYVSILSGQPANRVFDTRLRQSLVVSFRESGFRTAAITEGGFVSSYFGVDLGFEEYVEDEGAVQLLVDGRNHDPTRAGGIERTFQRATAWLEEHREDRFFLLVHTYEPHVPYTRGTFTSGLDPGAVGESFTADQLNPLRYGKLRFGTEELEYLAALYDGGILESDRHVGALLDSLQALGLARTTLVVITSDHGEELGDHYPAHVGDHGHSLLDDQLRVPLILRDPRGSYPVRRVKQQVRTMDILPTVADLLGVDLHDPIEGRSLVPLMLGTERAGRVAFGGETDFGPPRAFVRHMGYKFIRYTGEPIKRGGRTVEPPRVQLYDLARDPDETRNLATQRSDLVSELGQLLDDLEGGRRRGVEVEAPDDPALRDRLRSLGYLD